MAMTRWEYQVWRAPDRFGSPDPGPGLNAWGDLGWELVAVVHGVLFYLKRPVLSAANDPPPVGRGS